MSQRALSSRCMTQTYSSRRFPASPFFRVVLGTLSTIILFSTIYTSNLATASVRSLVITSTTATSLTNLKRLYSNQRQVFSFVSTSPPLSSRYSGTSRGHEKVGLQQEQWQIKKVHNFPQRWKSVLRDTTQKVNSKVAMLSSATSDNAGTPNTDDDDTDKNTPAPTIYKSHCTTICMVPPPSAEDAWDALTKARKELRDPGFYRWPPHANLLYPFLQFPKPKDDSSPVINQDVVVGLQRAAARSKPFYVTLQKLGTFGGKNRGVLWIYPHSSCNISTHENDNIDDNDDAFCNPSEPLIQLQSYLEEEFPICNDQQKTGRFHPHMTLSHFENLDHSLQAQEQIESWWNKPISFLVKEVYLLQRTGDEGQFQIVATIPLGGKESQNNGDVQVHNPPLRFPAMPETEEQWVYEERMKLKQRRNKNGRGRRGGGRRRRQGRNKERKVDTPEEIEAKRAARKAKREALELLQQQQQEEEEQQQS